MGLSRADGERLWGSRWATWVAACQMRHGGKYTYPTSERLYREGVAYVRIVCPEHGEFTQAPAKHKRGQGCPLCAGNVPSPSLLSELRAKFPLQEFPDTLPRTSKEVWELECPKHGKFKTRINTLLTRPEKHDTPCPKCVKGHAGEKRRVEPTEWQRRLATVHPDVQFHVPSGVVSTDRVSAVCPRHGQFTAKLVDAARGVGCPTCASEARKRWNLDNLTKTFNENVMDAVKVHGHKYIYHRQGDVRTADKVKVTCIAHGTFNSRFYSLIAGHGCPRCSHRISKPEKDLQRFLIELGEEIVTQDRAILGDRDVDIYLPQKQIGIEFCGLYWHGEHFKAPDYHLLKFKEAQEAGVRLITIFEDEWMERQDVVRKTLSAVLGKIPSIGARKTQVVKPTWKEVETFLEANHLQGAGTPCAVRLGLTLNGRLVSVMTAAPDRFSSRGWEIVRFASSIRVVGGLSKLVNSLKVELNPGVTIISYCDLRWFTGQSYTQAGFRLVEQSTPGYWWCRGLNRHSRQQFQKHKLGKRLNDFDPTLTEVQNMHRNGYWRVWDCGMTRWELKI